MEGRRLKPEDLNGIYKDMAETLGLEITRIISGHVVKPIRVQQKSI